MYVYRYVFMIYIYTYIYIIYMVSFANLLCTFLKVCTQRMYLTHVFPFSISGQTVSPEISQASFRESNHRLKLRVNLPVPESVKIEDAQLII